MPDKVQPSPVLRNIMVKGYHCERCGYDWVPRIGRCSGGVPIVCARCHSPYWFRRRKDAKT